MNMTRTSPLYCTRSHGYDVQQVGGIYRL